jgi:uncharacterized cofD-like protein
MKQKVVSIGGGSGQSNLLLALKDRFDLTAIVSETDSGGSSGVLRSRFGVLPPGDITRCMISFSTLPEKLKRILDYRISYDSANDHEIYSLIFAAAYNVTGSGEDAVACMMEIGRTFGGIYDYEIASIPSGNHTIRNLIYLAARETLGSDEFAIHAMSNALGIRFRVLPVTTDQSHLYAELEDGTVLKGESSIDSGGGASSPIKKVWLSPEALIYPLSAGAILNADLIVLTPGDLYTSIIPNLLVRGVREMMSYSNARLAYVSNLFTKHGETDGFSIRGFLDEIEAYLGKHIDHDLVNTGRFPSSVLRSYEAESAYPVENVPLPDYHVHEGDFSAGGLPARHDAVAVAGALEKIACLAKHR